MSTCRSTLLFTGSLVAIRDVHCTSGPGIARDEEVATGHHLVFTRRGVFIRHSGAGKGTAAVADAAQVLLFNRDEPYRVAHPAVGGDECTVLAFRGLGAAEQPFSVPAAPVTPAQLYRLQRLRAAAVDTVDPLRIEEDAIHLLSAVLAAGRGARGLPIHAPRRTTLREYARVAADVRTVLAVEPGRAHSLSSLAREVGRSPYQLARIFRCVTGTSIHQYLLRLRIGLALERLAQGEDRLSALAFELGFVSHSHFSTVFRRLVGQTPAGARRRLRFSAPR